MSTANSTAEDALGGGGGSTGQRYRFVRHYHSLADAAADAYQFVMEYVHRGDAAALAAATTPGLHYQRTPDGTPLPRRAVAVFDLDDTLVRKGGGRIPEVVDLAKRLAAAGVGVHIVTARVNDAASWAETLRQLDKLGVVYHTVSLAPPARRSDLAAVSQWKHEVRRYIASVEEGAPVTLSVGDMASDLFPFDDEAALDDFDAAQGAHAAEAGVEPPKDARATRGRVLHTGGGAPGEPPISIVRPYDGASLYGMKMREVR